MKDDEGFGKIVKSDEVRSGLISLIDKRKDAFHGGISEIVKREFDLISAARRTGASWTEIAETLGFSGKEKGISLSFWRERKRREKKGGMKKVQEKPTVPREPITARVPGKGQGGEKKEEGERKVHMLPDEVSGQKKNQFERSKLY